MSNCLALNNPTILTLLLNLSKPDLQLYQQKFETTLHLLSKGKERTYQPGASITNRPEGQKLLFRPFTAPSAAGVKIITTPAPENGKQDPLHGVVVVTDHKGNATGLLKAEEITGFRTAFSAIIPFTWRTNVERILVFGAGKQALWHIRLALALRGDGLKKITVVNRSPERARALVEQVREENRERWKAGVEIESLDPGDGEVKTRLATVDAIFCTVGSTEPLFSVADLARSPTSERQPYISAVGSWQPDMLELDPALLRYTVSEENESNKFNPTRSGRGAVLVDDREAALQHSGEVVQSGLQPDQLMEIGEVVEMQQQDKTQNDELSDWLQTGLLVYKSIGVSLTDLTTSEYLLEIARARGLGSVIPDF